MILYNTYGCLFYLNYYYKNSVLLNYSTFIDINDVSKPF